MRKWQRQDLNPVLPDANIASSSTAGKRGRWTEERYSELASVSAAHRGRREEGACRMPWLCKSYCLKVSKGNRRQMGLEWAM